MTVSTLSGMALADIPAEYFDEPFETWTGKLPALVLASTRTGQYQQSVEAGLRILWRTPGRYLPCCRAVAGYLSGNDRRGQRGSRFCFYR